MLSRPLKQQFATAIRRLLGPIVRQLITYGISYSTFSEMVKEIYVEVAETDFPLPFKRQTDSRLALVTGVNRKEISRLRHLRKTARRSIEVEDTLATHVVGRWLGGSPYSNVDGSPRRLPYDSERANAPSFTRLVRSLSVDIPVRSILDELLHIGAVELLEDGDVQLVHEAHIPAGDLGGKLTLLGSDPAELFATISHNIEHPEMPRLQRKVVYDNIGSEALAELRAAARKLGEEFIRKANQLVASYDRDRNPRAPGGRQARVALGTYYFEEETPSPPQPGRKAQRRPPGRIRRSKK
jgi:hypothetical protein